MGGLIKENNNKNESAIVLKLEDKNSLVGFFALLLKVDKRINPSLYKSIKQKDNYERY